MASSPLAFSAPSSASPSAGDVGARLEAARGAIEGRFLEVGDVLSTVVDGMNALISALDRMRDGISGGEVAAATRQLGEASSTLKSLPDMLRERRGRLGELVKVGDALSERIDEMRQHLAYLRVFGVNIKITSGGIVAAGPEFAIFAQEICDCIELGRGQLDTFRTDLSGLDTALRGALSQEDALGRRCEDLLPAVPDALSGQAEAIAAHQARIAVITEQVAGLAREVRKKIGAALAALQIGDITRQRIEHVQLGLRLLASPQVAALPAQARDRLSGFMNRLLAAQLSATIEDFHRDVSRIGDNVGAIALDAGEILKLRDHAQGRSADGDASFLRGLEASVGQAFALVDDIDAGERQAEHVGQAAAQSAQELSAQIAAIQNMRADVQMMALNTTLKCSRIGETGKPLGVIAIELRQHATHLETSAARTLTALESLAASAEGQAAQARGAGGAAQASAALRDAVDRIRTTGDAVEGDLADAARQGGEVVDMLRRAAARFDFQRQIGVFLDQSADALAREAGPEDARLDDVMTVLSPMLADMARAYTMAQEREVHAALTAELGEVLVETVVKAVEDDDVFF
ncbi:hypothetical protein [Caulobacter sp. RHG1]|uniref:hypothetical protein n=1 Tax=Caulobacter sp. (strain RHG1) TaxID=2545762 RepID=UPI001554D54C|nr:hypothetical protein [Caulobacter sp. RHG1]NQE63457.1 hypothetical protein [Caulobacter sp. RHG1]